MIREMKDPLASQSAKMPPPLSAIITPRVTEHEGNRRAAPPRYFTGLPPAAFAAASAVGADKEEDGGGGKAQAQQLLKESHHVDRVNSRQPYSSGELIAQSRSQRFLTIKHVGTAPPSDDLHWVPSPLISVGGLPVGGGPCLSEESDSDTGCDGGGGGGGGGPTAGSPALVPNPPPASSSPVLFKQSEASATAAAASATSAAAAASATSAAAAAEAPAVPVAPAQPRPPKAESIVEQNGSEGGGNVAKAARSSSDSSSDSSSSEEEEEEEDSNKSSSDEHDDKKEDENKEFSLTNLLGKVKSTHSPGPNMHPSPKLQQVRMRNISTGSRKLNAANFILMHLLYFTYTLFFCEVFYCAIINFAFLKAELPSENH